MGPSNDELSQVESFGELDICLLSNELATNGESQFKEKYSTTFLVSVSQHELNADTYTYKTSISSDSNEFETLENIPLAMGGRSDSPHKKTCYCVVKKGRTSFTSKITVGRSRNNDIVLRSQKISKLHAALIKSDEGDWRIEDFGSSNGTEVNQIKLEKNEQSVLLSGDIVAFGSLVFRFMNWKDFRELLLKQKDPQQ